MTTNQKRCSGPGWVPRGWALVVLTAGVSGGCSSLLEVKAPSRVEADSLERPANAPLLVASAISDFECALGRYIVGAGLVGDEFQDAQLASAMWPYDQRTFTAEGGQYATSTCNEGAIGIYTPLSTARWQADNALAKLEAWTDAEVPNRTSLIAKAAAYSGYSHVLMGEGMCSAAFDQGPELTRAEIFTRAQDRFTKAIDAAQTAGETAILNLARVGRARTLLNLGKKAEASAGAEGPLSASGQPLACVDEHVGHRIAALVHDPSGDHGGPRQRDDEPVEHLIRGDGQRCAVFRRRIGKPHRQVPRGRRSGVDGEPIVAEVGA